MPVALLFRILPCVLLAFPTEGCWQVTGKVGPVTLTFVTFVIKAGH